MHHARQQIKIFKGVENELVGLEGEINRWLEESGARIIQMTGNIAPQSGDSDHASGGLSKGFTPSDVLIVVLYELP